jgi:uncharacterized membrane protein YgcG
MNDKTELEAMVQDWLDEIKPVPARNPQAAARGRARFLAQAVSASEFQRHKGWKSIFRKEQFAMNMLMSILVIAGLLFGGGATVNAAQDDLPNDPLYSVKTWSEDVSLQFQDNPDAKIDRLMELAQIRVQEMTQLIDSGQTPPDQVTVRLEKHMQQALKICSNMEDAALDQTLLQIRNQLQQQDRDMERLQAHAARDVQPILAQTRTMLRQRLQLVEDGLLNHEIFRNRVRNGFNNGQTQTPSPSLTSTPLAPNRQQNGQSTPQAVPNNGNGPGPNSTPSGSNINETPNGNGSGSGSGDNDPGGNGSGGSGSGGNGSGGSGSGGNKP